MPEIDKKKLFEKNPIFKKTRVSLKTAVFHAIYLKNCSWMNIYNYTSNFISSLGFKIKGKNNLLLWIKKKCITSQKPGSSNFQRIANSVLNIGRFAIDTLPWYVAFLI